MHKGADQRADILVGDGGGEGDAQGTVQPGAGQTEGGENVAGLAFVAGGAGGDADAHVAQHTYDVLCLVAGEGDGADMRGIAIGDDFQFGERFLQCGKCVLLDGGSLFTCFEWTESD